MIWTLWKADGTTKLYTDHKFLWEEIRGTKKNKSHRALGQNLKGPQAARESIAKAVIDLFCHSQGVWGDVGGPGLRQPWGMEGCDFLLLEIMVSQFTNLHEASQRLESRPQWSQEAGFLPRPPLPTLGLPLDTFTVLAPHHYLICHLGQQKSVPTEAFRCDNSC